jgi:hypothetical protein
MQGHSNWALTAALIHGACTLDLCGGLAGALCAGAGRPNRSVGSSVVCADRARCDAAANLAESSSQATVGGGDTGTDSAGGGSVLAGCACAIGVSGVEGTKVTLLGHTAIVTITWGSDKAAEVRNSQSRRATADCRRIDREYS